MSTTLITSEMIARYYELSKIKKELEAEMNDLKEIFHIFFDDQVGGNMKGELIVDGLKLQRQIRKTEKYREEETVQKLEELNMNDLILIVKQPDDEKIAAALNLGLLAEEDLKGCKLTSYSKAISVKEV